MNNKKMILWFAAAAVLLSGNNAALAADYGNIRISGFLTTIFTKGTNDKDVGYANGLAEKDVELDTRDNHLGVQFASTINSDTKVTAQMISRGGETNSYNMETDWAYVDYQALESVRFRIGKYKIPEFIASDYLDVGYAYPWVRPPQDVYATNPLISLNGVDMLYKINAGSSALFLDLYYGDGTHKTFVPPRTVDLSGGTLPASMKGQQVSFDTKNTVGFGIKYVAPHYTVRAGYFKTKVTQEDFMLTDVPGALPWIYTTSSPMRSSYAVILIRIWLAPSPIRTPGMEHWATGLASSCRPLRFRRSSRVLISHPWPSRKPPRRWICVTI